MMHPMNTRSHVAGSMALPLPVVYSSDRPFGSWRQLRQVADFGELFATFIERDLKVRYRQTLLGAAWAALPPVMLMIVFSVFLGRFVRVPSEGIPYPAFAYTALLPWTFFSSALTAATTSITSNSAIISKVAFPREILPWTAIASSAADFLAGAAVFALLVVYYQIPMTWMALLVVPLLIVQVLLMAGLTLVFAAFNVYFRDVRFAVPLLLQVWLFATPVVYSATEVPHRLKTIYLLLNPMAALIDAHRKVLLHGRIPDLAVLSIVTVTAAVVFCVCYAVFKRLDPDLVDIV